MRQKKTTKIQVAVPMSKEMRKEETLGPSELTLCSKNSQESNLVTSNEQMTTHAMTTFDN